MTTTVSKLTNEVKAMIGVEGEFIEASWWIVEKEGLRRFTQALMDPDPRMWDEEFARESRFGEIVTPGIYVMYLDKTPPWEEDPVARGFRENPVSDGIGGVRAGRGALPDIPTDLVRILNAGNDIEVFQYPSLGDRIYAQSRYANIEERVGRDGSHMLITTTETLYYNQRADLLCITRGSRIRR
ncbi:MAG: MaoC family dehydratase N-terminal domain-containing protein [Dehalococcoidia bacterium]|nr:MaoC family dehydratase N-terminal domain-containing protein [Dehalococcoidia bacterium]